MKDKGIFEKYYSRLAREGILKSAIAGIIVGFCVDFVIAFVGWFFGETIWLYLAIGIGLLAGVAAGVVAYFKFFQPNTKSIARRIDSLGLEERMVTMTELEKDESYIAMRQREDAKAALAKVEPKAIRLQLSRTLVILAVVAFTFGSAMTVVSALTSFDILPTPGQMVNPDDDKKDGDYVFVTYAADEGGYFYDADGATVTEIDLEVLIGDSAPTVIAVADEGWMFDGWSDGVTTPERKDVDIDEDLFLLAFFIEVEEDGVGMEGPGMSGNRPGNSRPGDNETNGNRPSEGTNAGGARYEPANRVYDGNTPYGDVYDEFYEQAMEELANNKNLTPKQRAMLEAYCESLRAGAMKSEDGDD